MKMTKWIAICLLAVALAPVGCSKKDSGTPNQPPAVSVDVPKLRDVFTTASPDLQNLSKEAVRNIQYGNYPKALEALEKLAAASSLTDAQKQVVTEVTGQVKQMASRAAAPPAQ
jgi:hypothetical protein